MSTQPPLALMPNQQDLISSAVAAGIASYQKDNFGAAFAEHLGSVIVAKNLSLRTTSLDQAADSTLKEEDIWTAISRGVISSFMGKSANKAGMNAAISGVANIGARLLSASFLTPSSSVTA